MDAPSAVVGVANIKAFKEVMEEMMSDYGKCGSCKFALAVDAALKFGLVTDMEYKVYTHSAYPDWPSSRISRIERSFAICKKTKNFIMEDETCSSWQYRDYGTDFGRL